MIVVVPVQAGDDIVEFLKTGLSMLFRDREIGKEGIEPRCDVVPEMLLRRLIVA